MDAVVYIRVSKVTEVSSIHSVDTQRDIVYSYAKRNGINVIAEFVDENVSGGKLERENLHKAVDLVKRKRCVLLCKDLSRLSRSSHQTLRLLSEVQIVDCTLGMNADSKVLSIMALANQWEREACSVRQKQTIAYLRKMNPNRKFGCAETLVQGRKTARKNQVHKADLFSIKLAPFLLEDAPLIDVCHRLMELGITTQRGNKRWNVSSVHKLRKRLRILIEEGRFNPTTGEYYAKEE